MEVMLFLKYFLKYKSLRKVHSPFVYRLATECIYNKSPREEYRKIIDTYSHILVCEALFGSKALGAGSKRKRVAKPEKPLKIRKYDFNLIRYKLLFRLSDFFKPSTILELGTSFGLGSYALKLGSPDAKLVTIEGSHVIKNVAEMNFERWELDNYQAILGNIDEVLPQIIKDGLTPDLVYFDANHTEKATMDYFYCCLSVVSDDSVFVFDDIRWSKGMFRAWEKIFRDERVVVSIDVGTMGIVLFRRTQAKQHFILKPVLI